MFGRISTDKLIDLLKATQTPSWTSAPIEAGRLENAERTFAMLTEGEPRLCITVKSASVITQSTFTLAGLDEHIAELIRQRDLLAKLKGSE